jgi:hypothetical protein
VVNGSPTQTAMADRAGARTQLAQVVFAGCVFVVLLALTSPLQDLPHCVPALIVFTIAIGMIDIATLRAMRPEPGRIQARCHHGGGCRYHWCGAGCAAGDHAFAFETRASKLPAPHGGAAAASAIKLDSRAHMNARTRQAMSCRRSPIAVNSVTRPSYEARSCHDCHASRRRCAGSP